MEFEKVTVTDTITPVSGEFTREEPTPETSTDLACEVCGTPLVYSGRGRKPRLCEDHKNRSSSTRETPSGSRGGAGRGSTAVEQAVATLGNLYDVLNMGFYLTDQNASRAWTDAVPDLQTRNRAILAADPELTKSINRLGVRGGKFAFAAAQIAALTPAVMIAGTTLRAKAEARASEQRAQQARANMRAQNAGARTSGGAGSATGTDTGFPPGMGNRGFFE